MATIYREVHFSWAIDFFEQGQNSEWLLPNRLYEGCRFGAVPISMGHTETGRFLDQQGIGVLLPEATPEALEAALGEYGGASFREVAGACSCPQSADLEPRSQRLPGASSRSFAG